MGGGLALRDADLLHDLGAGARLVLVQLDRLLQLRLVALHALQALRVGLVGVVEADLKLVDLALKSLLDPQGLTLSLLLGLKRSRHGLHGASVVLPGVVELLLLLGHAPVNLLLDLSKLQLGTKDLVLLLLEGALSLLKSSLQLLLLLLKPPPLLVQVVDGTAALTKLVEKILDLVSEVLVLALDNVQLLKSLLLGGLQPEQLGGVVATLVLGGSDLGGDISSLGLPLAEHLVEVLASLLGDQGSSVHPLVLHGQVVELSVHPGLGLLSIGHLAGERVDQLLVLDDLGLQLVASGLELLNAAHALGLEAGLPQLDLGLRLGESLEGIRLPGVLVLQLLPEVLQVGGHHLVLGQQRRAVLVLGVSKSLGVLKLGGHGDLALVHVGNGGLKLVDLAREILVLDLQPLLGGLSLVEGSGHLVQPGVGVNDVALQQLAGLIKVSLALDSILQVATGITEVELHVGLVLLGLHLVGAEAVNLLTEISHGVVVLHAKSSKGALVSDVQLLQLRLEAGKLALPLLVELHLGGGVGAGLLQLGRDVLDVLLQHGAALLGLGAVATLDSQLLVKLLKPGLQLLGLLGVLGAKGGLIVDLGGKSAALLVLASSS